MPLRRFLTSTAVILITGASALGQAPAAAAPNERVEAAITAYQEALQRTPLTSANYEEMRQRASDILDTLDLNALRPADFERLVESMLIGRSLAATQTRIDARLAELAKDPGVEGARAAMLRTMTNTMAGSGEEGWKARSLEDKNRLMAVMAHPGLPQAAAAGQTKLLFANGSISADLADDAYAEAVLKVLEMPLNPDAAGRLWYAYMPLVEAKSPASDGTRERVRVACVAQLERALKAPSAENGAGGVSSADRAKRLKPVLAGFNGAYAKRQLVGYPAPEVEFQWTDAAGSPGRLSDLKGKVVVLDFWAVWCGPCVESFPQVRELQARYKDYPVVILGVTDLEGTPMPKGFKRGDSLDPQAQASALAAWSKDKGVTWPLAIGSTGVFNPEYGVRGIPHVVIIDPEGKVRFRGMHPASKPEEKHERIGGILKEFKLPSPSN